MKLVICRVLSADLSADGKPVSKTDKGLFCLLGVIEGDGEKDADILAKKLSAMRIFSDESGKMNLSVKDVGGEILVCPNFTLGASIKHGNRPDFFSAMKPEGSKPLFEYFVNAVRAYGITVYTGVFGADMKIGTVMDGPVTIVADSKDLLREG